MSSFATPPSPASSSSHTQAPAWMHPDRTPDVLDDMDEDDLEQWRDKPFEDTLEDLTARFMVNLPSSEITLVRLYWQAEQAHWFYEDLCRPVNPALPALTQKEFTQKIILAHPLYANLTDEHGDAIDIEARWGDYMSYKRMVPTCGVILVNRQGDKVLLVRGWLKGSSWSFPRGKINERESEVDCAIRECEEETGYDCSRLIDPKAKFETYVKSQSMTMFFVTGVDENTKFEAQTRKEIGAIEWVKLQNLPTWKQVRAKGAAQANGKSGKKFFNVVPFVGPLRKHLKAKGILNQNTEQSDPASNTPAKKNGQGGNQAAGGQPTAPSASAGTSSLDRLFADFVKKQEQDLSSGGMNIGGTDNKAGLERLFGGLSTTDHQAQQDRRQSVADEQGSDSEDVLARLLGAIGPSETPAPVAPPPPAQAKLLAVLNAKPSPAVARTVTPPASQAQRPSKPSPVLQSRPHQASLLAVLSSNKGQSSTPSSDHTVHGNKPTSLPTSPRPASPTEANRKDKQRALLEMTIAGIGLDSSSRNMDPGYPPHHQHQQPHQQQQPSDATPPNAVQHMSTYNGNHTRVTPPNMYNQQHQYRPPVPPQPQPQPASFAPPAGTYYPSNAPAPAVPPPQQQHHAPGGGSSPSRNRGAPPPYESHFAGQAGPSRPPPPPVMPVQPPMGPDYSHPHAYQNRPPPIPHNIGQGYRPQQQPYNTAFQQQQQPPFVQQQHPPPAQYYHPGPNSYQAPPVRPVPHHPPPLPQQQQQQQYQPPPNPPPQVGYNSVPQHGPQYSHYSGGPSGPMHQPIPKNGPQTGMLLAMLNERGR